MTDSLIEMTDANYRLDNAQSSVDLWLSYEGKDPFEDVVPPETMISMKEVWPNTQCRIVSR
jgi:hypothetical protein